MTDRILLVSPASPFAPQSGAQQRTALLHEALLAMGEVDVLLREAYRCHWRNDTESAQRPFRRAFLKAGDLKHLVASLLPALLYRNLVDFITRRRSARIEGYSLPAVSNFSETQSLRRPLVDYKDPPSRSGHTLHMPAHRVDPPKVGIVIATYNRSHVLAHAIESVRRSSLTDWELLVVGDNCTDDTTEVVAGFHDSRIRFVNLEHNVGEQSGPNNVGASLVRAPILAFLNHDDLFFPDHLARSLSHLETMGADLVFSGVAAAEPRSIEQLV